jgi:ketosteroid isomerase-like protein
VADRRGEPGRQDAGGGRLRPRAGRDPGGGTAGETRAGGPAPEAIGDAADPRVELLRSFYERWSAGDYVRAATLLFDPEVELVQPPELPAGGGNYHGYEGLQRALDESLEAWEYLHAEAERFVLRKDTVVAIVRLRSRGRHTEMELDRRIGHVFGFRGDRAVRWEVYWSPDEALAAAGLGE